MQEFSSFTPSQLGKTADSILSFCIINVPFCFPFFCRDIPASEQQAAARVVPVAGAHARLLPLLLLPPPELLQLPRPHQVRGRVPRAPHPPHRPRPRPRAGAPKGNFAPRRPRSAKKEGECMRDANEVLRGVTSALARVRTSSYSCLRL